MAMVGSTMLLLVVLVIGAEALSPPRISYCRNRLPSPCCRNVRDDDCSVPIRDTYCYCDDFCLEGNHGKEGDHTDCCPDFWEVCRGIEPSEIFKNTTFEEKKGKSTTTVCIHDDKPLSEGTYVTLNCNECVCKDGIMKCDEDLCLVDEELISQVNSNPHIYGWTATNYSMFWGRKAKEGLVLRTGTLQLDGKTRKMLPILLRPDLDIIPREFDARSKWSISGVMDQGWCGASWVFSTLGVAQDRHMILASQQNVPVTVSLAPQQLLSCSPFQVDCKGGYIDRAWMYMRKSGVIEETCYPYSSGSSGKVPACHKDSRTLACKNYKTEPAYRISEKEEDIQWEIMTNGPVQAMMRVHRNLFLYRGGVYRCVETDKEETGMHSVRILGWGEDTTTFGSPPTKYWLVANSWGTEWGEDGLFKIQRGSNTCGIESYVLAVRGRRDAWLKNKGV